MIYEEEGEDYIYLDIPGVEFEIGYNSDEKIKLYNTLNLKSLPDTEDCNLITPEILDQ